MPLTDAPPAEPRKEQSAPFLAALLLLSMLPVVAIFVIQYRSATRAAVSREQIQHIQEVITQQLELHSRMSDAALAAHGYMFTGDARFTQALAAANRDLTALAAAAGSKLRHPPAKEHFTRIETLMRELTRLIDEIVQLRQQGSPGAGEPEHHLEVWRLREALRHETDELLKVEDRLLIAETAEALHEDRWMRAFVLGGGLVTILLLGVTSAGLMRQIRRRHSAEVRLREANATLEARVAERTAELSEQKQRLQAVVDTAAEGIVTIDERGVVDSMNAAAERLFGYRADEVIGRNVSLLMPSPHREQHDAYLARYCETGEAKIIGIGREVAGQRKDGTVFPLSLAVSEFTLGGRRIFTGLVRDLTERKRLEAAVTSSAEEERGRIARDLHDSLGQELGGALFLGDLLQRDLKERGAAEAERAAQIHALVEKALADVREIARGLYPVPSEPDGLITALQNLADRVTRDCRIECSFDADSALLLEDRTTATHLYRIAQEAVNNALKHSGAARIDIRLAATTHSLEISVRDHGTGWRQNSPASGGLGMQTMKHRANLIGGQLTAGNAPGGNGVLVCCSVARFWRGTSWTASAMERPEGKL